VGGGFHLILEAVMSSDTVLALTSRQDAASARGVSGRRTEAGTSEEPTSVCERTVAASPNERREVSEAQSLLRALPRSLPPRRETRTVTEACRRRQSNMACCAGEAGSQLRAPIGADVGMPSVSQLRATTACWTSCRALRRTRSRSRARPERRSRGAGTRGGGIGQGSRARGAPSGAARAGKAARLGSEERLKAPNCDRTAGLTRPMIAAMCEKSREAPGNKAKVPAKVSSG
jgi:hypothetical protein